MFMFGTGTQTVCSTVETHLQLLHVGAGLLSRR